MISPCFILNLCNEHFLFCRFDSWDVADTLEVFEIFWISCCICGEGELVGGVHTLVWRSVQVYHELQELEEGDKGREEVQEIERQSKVEEKGSRGHDYGDDMKGLKHLEPRCVCR